MNGSAAERGPWAFSRHRPPTQPVLSTDIALAVLILIAVVMLLLPVPTAFIDLFLSLQLAGAVFLILSSVGVTSSHRLALFPTLLLVSTLFRLALNVSTTRLILAQADAGQVVYAFGTFAVEDHLVVGVIILLVIALVQLVVIARGSERVAEVAARFSLDAMPGRQMAIDADVRAGFIDAHQAKIERVALQRESRFYGAMDGAMRFIKGDAIVAMVIVVVNLVGGLTIGMSVHEMSVGDALTMYTRLAIGDGLAAQIPALFISVAAGLTVARATANARQTTVDNMRHGAEPLASNVDLSGRRWAYRAVAAVATLFCALAFVPGLPTMPFAGTAMLTASLGVWLWRRDPRDTEPSARGKTDSLAYLIDERMNVSRPAVISMSLHPQFARMMDAHRPEGQFTRRVIEPIRRHLTDWLAIDIPAVAVSIGAEIDADEQSYRLRIHGIEIDRAVLAHSDISVDLHTRIERRWRRRLRQYAFDIITVHAVSAALDRLAEQQPQLVREVIPAVITRARLTVLLRRMVREGLAIRDLSAILLALLETAPRPEERSVSVDVRIDTLRCALARMITAQYAPDQRIAVWRLAPFIVQTLRDAVESDERGEFLALEPDIVHNIVQAIKRAVGHTESHTNLFVDDPADEDTPVLIVPMDVRRLTAGLLVVELPALAVLCPEELTSETLIETVSLIDIIDVDEP